MAILSRCAACLALLAPLLAFSPAALADKRVALVVGIGAYENLSDLANPVGDAGAIAASLRGRGYEVFEHYDLKRGDFLNALEDFQRIASEADVALVYYAGHGMEIAGKNILAPIDTEVSCEPKEARRTVEVEELFEALGQAKNQVVLLDACRDDPVPAMREPQRWRRQRLSRPAARRRGRYIADHRQRHVIGRARRRRRRRRPFAFRYGAPVAHQYRRRRAAARHARPHGARRA